MSITRINLLPWREELRQEQKKQFGVMAMLTCVLAAAIVGLIHIQMQSKIDYQQSRNNYISDEIAKVDEEIKEISELQKVRRSLVERMCREAVLQLFICLLKLCPQYRTEFIWALWHKPAAIC